MALLREFSIFLSNFFRHFSNYFGTIFHQEKRILHERSERGGGNDAVKPLPFCGVGKGNP